MVDFNTITAGATRAAQGINNWMLSSRAAPAWSFASAKVSSAWNITQPGRSYVADFAKAHKKLAITLVVIAGAAAFVKIFNAICHKRGKESIFEYFGAEQKLARAEAAVVKQNTVVMARDAELEAANDAADSDTKQATIATAQTAYDAAKTELTRLEGVRDGLRTKAKV